MSNIPADSDMLRPATTEELASYGLWGRVRRMRLLERASRSMVPTGGDFEKLWIAFCKANRIDPKTGDPVPARFEGCEPSALRGILAREAGLSAWKAANFSAAAKRRFLERKPGLDRVVYSLVRVRDAGLARELWFRLGEGEATFAGLAAEHAAGEEAHTGGVVGPVPLSRVHPALAALLASAAEGELLQPHSIGGWFLVARLDRRIPAVFDRATKAAMVEELVEQWLTEQEKNERSDT